MECGRANATQGCMHVFLALAERTGDFGGYVDSYRQEQQQLIHQALGWANIQEPCSCLCCGMTNCNSQKGKRSRICSRIAEKLGGASERR